MLYTTMNSPVGELLLVGDETALRGVHFAGDRFALARSYRSARQPFALAREQLEEYFAGARTRFDVPLVLEGPAFHRRVWDALLTIPYGETRSYGQIAAQVGDPGAARAVGFANGRNPIAIVVPCHRVIGANGNLTGYGGGLPRKRSLLDLEAGVLSLTA
jgi:methylated-DNA-[protein]-cysteine S-methyltransferase